MSLCLVERKTCNEVKIRQSSLLRAKPASALSATILNHSSGFSPCRNDECGLASHGEAGAAAACRDRIEQRIVPGKIDRQPAGRGVETLMNGAAPAAGLAIVTRRVARVQCIQTCGFPDALEKVASLPSVVAA